MCAPGNCARTANFPRGHRPNCVRHRRADGADEIARRVLPLRVVVLAMLILHCLRDDAAKVMPVARKVVASVAKDLVADALRDELAQVDHTQAFQSGLCVALR